LVVAGDGANDSMSWVEVPPAGNQVAITTPVFGEFVTVTSVSPVRGLPGTVTQSV